MRWAWRRVASPRRPPRCRCSEGGDQGVSDDGRFTWATNVAPYVAPDSSADLLHVTEAATVTLWRVGVTVTWPGTFGNTHSVVLSTVRLASKTPGLTK